VLLGRLQDAEGAHEAVVDGHDGARVVELAAVVWRRKDGHQLPVGEKLVAVLHHLEEQKEKRVNPSYYLRA